jgi:hypothetical protein
MVKLIDKDPIYLELYEALAHFVGRQQIVVRAVLDIGISPESMARGVSAWHDKTAQTGNWGRDWNFFFHGGGCELRHRLTDEPIDWTGPDPQAFGTMAFVQHLEWRLQFEAGLPQLRAFVQQHDALSVIELIDALMNDGVITSNRHVSPDVHLTRKTAA